jgi:hypothetical protein
MAENWELEIINPTNIQDKLKLGASLNALLQGEYRLIIEPEFRKLDYKNIERSLDFGDAKELFILGIACLYSFVQEGWTGPKLDWHSFDFVSSDISKEDWDRQWLSKLSVDGEDAYSLTPDPFLLYVARQVLVERNLGHKTSNWWKARCILTHQRLLDEFSETLFNAAIAAYSLGWI